MVAVTLRQRRRPSGRGLDGEWRRCGGGGGSGGDGGGGGGGGGGLDSTQCTRQSAWARGRCEDRMRVWFKGCKRTVERRGKLVDEGRRPGWVMAAAGLHKHTMRVRMSVRVGRVRGQGTGGEHGVRG